jgi:thioesterase domain-containing protein
MGGVLAVETARLAGHAATVVVVDADPTYRSTRDDGWDILVRQVLNIDLAADRLDAMPRAEALTLVRAEAAARGRLPARFRLDRLDRMARVCEANAHAADLHRPRRYPATVHSLRGLSTEAAPDSWVGVADRVVVCRIDADHHGLLSVEGSASIAACLRERGLLPGP